MNISTFLLALFCSVLVCSSEVPKTPPTNTLDRKNNLAEATPETANDGVGNLPAPRAVRGPAVLGDMIKIDKKVVRVASIAIYLGMMRYLLDLASQESDLLEASRGLSELTDPAVAAYTKLALRSAFTPILSMFIPLLTLPIGSGSWFIGTFIHCNQFIFQTIMMSLKHLTVDNYETGLGISAIANWIFPLLAVGFYLLSPQASE